MNMKTIIFGALIFLVSLDFIDALIGTHDVTLALISVLRIFGVTLIVLIVATISLGVSWIIFRDR